MTITSSITLGFIRLCFLLLFLYYLNRKFVNKSDSNNFLEFIVHQWFKYGSIIGVMLFVTIQLSIYDLLNCMAILLIIIAIDYISIQNAINFKDYFKTTSKKNFQKLIKHTEMGRPLKSWLDFKKKENVQGTRYFLFTVLMVLVGLTFALRFYFFKYDLYSLSGLWINDLQKIIDFDSQIWFLREIMVNGDLAFVSFYSKIADVSPEIALQSAGLLESTLLCVMIFYVVRKITPSKNIPSLIAALTFALAFTISPLNIYFLLQNKPIFLAMTFGLPAMVYLLKPGILKFRKINYFLSILLCFITIGLIDIFTLYILFPPFVLIAAIFTKKKSRNFFWLGLLGYVSAAVLIFLIYGAICIYFEQDLAVFIHSNLLSISSYTYFPQLLIPLENLMVIYQIASGVALLLMLLYIFYFKERWESALAYLLYFNLMILLATTNNPWLDTDLLNQGFAVLMPVAIGIFVAVGIRIFNPIAVRLEHLNRYAVISFGAAAIAGAYYLQRPVLHDLAASEPKPKQILSAYDKISKAYFPYSYAVVNENYTQVMSTNQHFFMNYTDFLYDYPQQDSIYFRHRHNQKFFKKNPQHVIPKSILLFVFEDEKDTGSGEEGDISPLLLDQVEMLKKRGRKVEVFYKNGNLKVYEIINEPGSSRITDLVF